MPQLRGACVALIFLAAVAASAGNTLVLPEKVAFSKDSRVRDKVKNECQLEEKVKRFIETFNKKFGAYDTVTTSKPESGAYHILSAEIIDVVGRGGGAWSGHKSVRIKGTLKDQSGKTLGTFIAERYSGGGAFGGYKGTCSILGRCTKAIGKDVAIWLQDPQMDSNLGDY